MILLPNPSGPLGIIAQGLLSDVSRQQRHATRLTDLLDAALPQLSHTLTGESKLGPISSGPY